MILFKRLFPTVVSCSSAVLRRLRAAVKMPGRAVLSASHLGMRLLRRPTSAKIRLNSLEFEISVMYTVILGMILVVFSGLLYVMLFFTLYTEMDNELKLKAERIVFTVNTYLEIKGQAPSALAFAVDKTISEQGKRLSRWWIMGFERRWFKQIDRLDLEEDYVNFLSWDKQPLFRAKSLPTDLLTLFLQNADLSSSGGAAFKNVTYNRRRIRLINYPCGFYGGKYILQVGVFQTPIAEAALNWLNSVIISVPIILLLTSFVGRVLARRILTPVEIITAAAQKITHEDLSARVKTWHPYEEMENLSQAFNDMIARLEKSFKYIEEFSYQVAHELKTPLTIIKGEAEVGLLSRRSHQEYQKALKINLEETDRMLRTIERLLYLARLDYQPGLFKFEEVDLGEFLREIHEQGKILCLSKRLDVRLMLPRELLTVKADPLHLRRLFLNLLDNALKFTPAGGTIDISARAEGENVVVSVADTGPGIPPELMPKLFERFFRGDESVDGCGLGLSIVRSIAKIHNGTIDIDSQPGRGTTFFVTLPLA
ncbi:MAG: ATP-binding protein [Candidatus Omnitrophota bacterium]|nr:ATP-binding protein [Candidatus Omnitrophota bacterium]MDZ4242217.1 ATP-binding protein [Candidatus Omnitrophota bacterium]